MRKLKISTQYLIVFLIILTVASPFFAQNQNYSVAAKWELYSVKDKKVSFLMPRLPVLTEQSNNCQGEISQTYAAYNDGVVYTVKITSKVEPREYCREKKKFDERNFSERLNQLKQNLTEETNSTNNISKVSIIKLTGPEKIVKLINNFDNKRWFEFAIFGADEKKSEVNNFLASLKIEKSITGIEIGEGAEQVFGDVASIVEEKITNSAGNVETIKRMLVKTDSKESKGIIVILKPRANYTDGARQNKIQGKVVLRVTFLAHGGIGNISVITGLENGLTEEAIKAARKLVFIPAQGDGARYSVTKPVEYSFKIF
jgi:TonB family protein